jgi:hypothetical protein
MRPRIDPALNVEAVCPEGRVATGDELHQFHERVAFVGTGRMVLNAWAISVTADRSGG